MQVLAVTDRNGFTHQPGMAVPPSHKGILEIHGAERICTWTKVATTVHAGSNRIITTTEPTDFAPGEKVVLSNPHQELTVKERIGDNGTSFSVLEYVREDHIAEVRNHNGKTIDMRCEVGLLTRNVVVQGAGLPRRDGSPTIYDCQANHYFSSTESKCVETDDELLLERVHAVERPSSEQLYGIHTGAFNGGYYRIENAEFRHCGQAGVLGRYCMHLHKLGDAPETDSYLRYNSIHHSFQRATTIHGTHHAVVKGNVAYDIMAHAYFIEDGDEMYNTFEKNLGVFIKVSEMALRSDKEPAVFWTRTAVNYWRDNVGTESESMGMWFDFVGGQ